MLAPLRGKPAVLSPAHPGQRATVVIPLLCCHRAPQPGPQRSWVLVGAGWHSDGVPMCRQSCLQAGLQLQDVKSKSSSGGTGAAAHFASPCRVPSAHYAHWYNAWKTTIPPRHPLCHRPGSPHSHHCLRLLPVAAGSCTGSACGAVGTRGVFFAL